MYFNFHLVKQSGLPSKSFFLIIIIFLIFLNKPFIRLSVMGLTSLSACSLTLFTLEYIFFPFFAFFLIFRNNELMSFERRSASSSCLYLTKKRILNNLFFFPHKASQTKTNKKKKKKKGMSLVREFQVGDRVIKIEQGFEGELGWLIFNFYLFYNHL